MIRIATETYILADKELSWLGDNVKREISRSAELVFYDSRELVFQGRDAFDSYLIVVSGQLQVLQCGQNRENLKNVVYERDSFGISFLFQNPLGYDSMVVAATGTLVVSIPLESMRRAILASSADAEVFKVFSDAYQAYHFVKNSTTFGDKLSTAVLVDLVGSFEKKTYGEEEFVIHQGDKADGYYMCVEGLLKVIVERGGSEVFSSLLKAGDYFGELAFLNSAPRAASVKALRRTRCFFLSVENFGRLMKKEPAILQGFAQLAKLAY